MPSRISVGSRKPKSAKSHHTTGGTSSREGAHFSRAPPSVPPPSCTCPLPAPACLSLSLLSLLFPPPRGPHSLPPCNSAYSPPHLKAEEVQRKEGEWSLEHNARLARVGERQRVLRSRIDSSQVGVRVPVCRASDPTSSSHRDFESHRYVVSRRVRAHCKNDERCKAHGQGQIGLDRAAA